MTEDTSPISTEITPEGEQVLVPGIAPITLRDRLVARMTEPMTPKRNPDAAQEPCDIGLFDQTARDQTDLIDLLRAAERGAPTPEQKQED
ncbi:hypothetical protein [Chelativorans salis]|uniref:Uncharacterized protein n=1 Tax=Chelativorans salis TaxID=2978478 RepID=A0ABT2LQ08_9HYPH|nr:hypothetical protein [Chelativorans sp. EGI FJ00035]MCT7376635.1 hypothetical protein [Chelativorans sp. EGI FJ00035]